MKNKRIKADIVDEEKQEREIRKQIERAEQMMLVENGADQGLDAESKLLLRNNGVGEKKIKLMLGSSSKSVGKEKGEGPRLVFEEAETET